MLYCFGAAVASMASAWFSWTGGLAFGSLAAHIYARVLFQRELELYTDPVQTVYLAGSIDTIKTTVTAGGFAYSLDNLEYSGAMACPP